MPTPKADHRLSPLAVHLGIAVIAFGAVAFGWIYVSVIDLLRVVPVLDRGRLHLEQNVQILDREGGLLYQFSGDENRIFLPSERIPEVVKKAVVAIEDERFWQRAPCIDVRAVLRSLVVNFLTDKIQGASTITQQLVRTLYLNPEKTIKRKAHEVILSCRLESILTKDEILTLYVNGVGFGGGIYGIEQASRSFFGIPAAKLSVAQAAVLASLPQRPTYFSPYGPHQKTAVDHAVFRAIRKGTLTRADIEHEFLMPGLLPRVVRTQPVRSRSREADEDGPGSVRLPGRSDAVLGAMLRLGFIDEKVYETASKELLRITFKPLRHGISSPYFALWIREEVESLLRTVDRPDRWRAAGLTVRTTLHPELQSIAEAVLEKHAGLLSKHGAKNAALVALDRRSREVIVYVGNTDFFGGSDDGQIDMARVPRQPGSSFKPLVYAAAFERGYTPETFILDEPIRIGTDEPKNFDGGYRGWMTARSAIGQSRNIPAIKAFLDAGGEDRMLKLASRVGMRTPAEYKREQSLLDPSFTYGWPMAIGAVEVPLLEMVQMYASIAERGVFEPLTYLCSVTDRGGEVSIPLFEEETEQVIAEEAAAGVDDILRDSSSKPDGYWRYILTIPGLDLGAKTGTSNLCFQRDGFGRCIEYGVNNVWTMGYSPWLVVGVWAGNADGSALEPLADGLTVAAPIWREFMEKASTVYTSQACG